MIEKVALLGLCTSHLTRSTASRMDTVRGLLHLDYPIYAKSDFGWFVPIVTDLMGSDLPDDLLACMTYAEGHGCTWIMFDRDIPATGDLPVYDW